MYFMPIFMIFFFFILLFIIIISLTNKKKIKTNQVVSEKYKQMAFKILNNNPKIEEERQKFKKRETMQVGVLIASIVCGFLMVLLSQPIFIFFAIAGFITFFILLFTQKDSVIFTSILPEILKEYNSDLSYNHKMGLSSAVYKEARFESYDRYHCDDLIEGKIGNYNFSMSEVHTERSHTDSDGHTTYTTIFHGAFAKVKLDKDFASYINVVNNSIKLFNRDAYINIDNEAFEKIYDVFTDDKIKAMRLLTPDVTSKMIDLYNETGIYCEIKILNDIMYIRLYTGPLFTISFSNPEKESELIGKSIAIIDSVFVIMKNFIEEIERFDV